MQRLATPCSRDATTPPEPGSDGRFQLRLGSVLLALVASVLLPALCVGGAATRQAVDGWQTSAEARARDAALTLSIVVAGELERYRSAAAVFISTGGLDGPEPGPRGIELQVRRASVALGAPMVLLEAGSMRQVVNTALPPGQTEATAALRLSAPAGTGRVAASPTITGAVLGRPVLGVAATVERVGQVRLLLAVLLPPKRLNRLLVVDNLPDGSVAVLKDDRGDTIAISGRLSDFHHLIRAGRPDDSRTAVEKHGRGSRNVGSDGVEHIYASLQVGGAPELTLTVAQPPVELDAAWRRPMLTLVVGSAGTVAFGLALACLTARGVLAPVARLSRQARTLAEAAFVAPASAAAIPPARIVELEALRQDLAMVQATIAAQGAALTRSKSQFRAVSDVIPDLLFAADMEGHTTYTNTHFQTNAGLPAADLLGFGWLRVVHPEDREGAASGWRTSLRTRQPFSMQYRLRQADGSYRWFLVRAMPVRDADGRMVNWCGILTDIEDIAKAREVLKRDKAALEKIVEARTAALEGVHQRLVQAQSMEAIGRLTAGVAHDFNNLLQTLLAGLEIASDEDTDRAEARESLEIAFSAAQRGARLTSQLMSFSRQQILHAIAIDMSTLLHNVRQTLAPILGRDILMRVDAYPDLPLAHADPDHLNSALLNLALNARDAMPGGGTITLEARLLEGRVVVAVSDTGNGMEPDVMARACEPFYTTKGVKGSGLGLSMVQGFAAQSGGKLRMTSEVGKGTRVELHLPLEGLADEASEAGMSHAGVAVSPQGADRRDRRLDEGVAGATWRNVADAQPVPA